MAHVIQPTGGRTKPGGGGSRASIVKTRLAFLGIAADAYFAAWERARISESRDIALDNAVNELTEALRLAAREYSRAKRSR